MEKKDIFLEAIKNLQNQKMIILSNSILGVILEIEEIEYMNFKLIIQVNENIYNGIHIEIKERMLNRLKKGNKIVILALELSKNERNIYIYSESYSIYGKDEYFFENENKISKDKNSVDKTRNSFDLNPKSLIKTMNNLWNIIYKSDIFIYTKNEEIHALISITDDKKFILGKNLLQSSSNEFMSFILENQIKDNCLILVDNYLFSQDNIKINNMTLFNLVKLEYIDEYFKQKLIKNNDLFNYDNKNGKIFYYKINSINHTNVLLIKVIDIKNQYILGIDYLCNIYKIDRNRDIFKKINDVFKIIFIKYFNLEEKDSIYIVELFDYSYIQLFDNNFKNLLLNDLTVINLHYIDFIEPSEKNYFNQIGIDDKFTFKISKKSEYVILIKKLDINYNYYPHTIKMISNNNKEIHDYIFLLYIGLLNNINILINYVGADKYGYEFFYYNFSYDLPKSHIITVENKIYNLEYSDNFNSEARKRFIIMNYYDKEHTSHYESMKEVSIEYDVNENFYKNYKTIEETEKKTEKKNDINSRDSIKINDDKDDKDGEDFTNFTIETKHNSLQFCFLYKDETPNLFGIYELEEIINKFQPKKKIIFKSNEYKMFYDYFSFIKKNITEVMNDNEYLESLEKYKKDPMIHNLIIIYDIDFNNISYESYIIYINLCLFYYLNQTKYKEELVYEFEKNFNILIKSKLSYFDRIRIMRFICKEYIKIADEDRRYDLLILDNINERNSYKIANNYNIKIINNLKENSKLYIAFLQLDGYILYNYIINSYSYTLSLEPLIVTKAHLLSSCDNFIFITKEKPHKNNVTYAYQNIKNDVTAINEYGLFYKINNRSSDLLKGNNFAVPISAELLHERNGHSKKDKKNKRNQSPLYFYTRTNLKIADENFQEIIEKDKDNDKNNPKGEAGLLVEYFVRYKSKNLMSNLKTNFNLGNIINDVKYFTSPNFKDLYEEITKLNEEKTIDIDKTNQISGHSDEQLNKIKPHCINKDDNDNKDKKFKNEEESSDISFYEKKYLLDGKYFVYPDSIPITYRNYNQSRSIIPKGKIEYLKKYRKEIIEGRKKHYELSD